MKKGPFLMVDENDIVLENLIITLGPPDSSRMMREVLRDASPELDRLEMWERESHANAGNIFIGVP